MHADAVAVGGPDHRVARIERVDWNSVVSCSAPSRRKTQSHFSRNALQVAFTLGRFQLAGTSSAVAATVDAGEFSRIAMTTRDFRKILQWVTESCVSGLQASFAKVLEYEPDENV